MWTELELEAARTLIRLGIREDARDGDPTTTCLISADALLRADITARADGILAGTHCAAATFREIDAQVEYQALSNDGDRIGCNSVLATVNGPARSILLGERLALNFLQRLSGIATLTAHFVKAVAGTRAEVFDTRKTTPAWRRLEKYAVRCGGGKNHRADLASHILIKDNHLKLTEKQEKLSRAEAVARAVALCRKNSDATIEVEVEQFEEMVAACEARATIVMLDNMSTEDITRCAKYRDSLPGNERPVLEASGGITLENTREIAEAGVDRISVGALTHSAQALNISMEVRQ